jgi:TRAP-type C4-dicarboxylate transport system permease small subunit
MNTQKIIAILLIVVGGLGLAYGGFTYTKKTNEANIGSLHLSVDEKEHVNVPLWAAVASLVLGGVLLVSTRKS